LYHSGLNVVLTQGSTSAVVLGNAVASLAVGDGVVGTGIPSGTTITAIDLSTRTVTLSAAATQSYQGSIAVWLWVLPVGTGALGTTASGDRQIAALYDAINNQIIVNNVNASAGAGYLSLEGAIINTGNQAGNIQVNNGNGQVTIDNQTGIPVVVNNVYAGSGS